VSTAPPDEPPLFGVRVIDLTRLLPGPLATRHLAELGAEVIKIEGPSDQGQDDPTRHMSRTREDMAAGRASLAFRMLNDGKQLRRLDLRDAAGRDALHALLADADVLVEGFRPGVMQRLGLGWAELHAAYPKLVVCAISGYGQHSVWSQRAGHDINYIAMAGVLEQVASAEGDIAVPNFQIGDLLGGTQAALAGVLAALVAAQRTGIGRYVDISMAHQVLRHNVLAASTLATRGRVAPPGRDLLSGGAPCYGAYRTADGRHLAVGALELKFWQALCEALQRPEWMQRHWSLGEAPGSAAALELRTQLAEIFAAQPLAHWTQHFDGVDCCVTPVLRLDEAQAHPLFHDASAAA
jgi:crotonobetainyl-CoA:carnitine CoA-transferase CaiB-like acyl-CoA transferase